MHAKRARQTEQEIGGPFRSAKTAQHPVITSSAISLKVDKSVLPYYITVCNIVCYINNTLISKETFYSTSVTSLIREKSRSVVSS